MDLLTVVIIVVILAAVCTIGVGMWLLIQRHREDRAAKPRKGKADRFGSYLSASGIIGPGLNGPHTSLVSNMVKNAIDAEEKRARKRALSDSYNLPRRSCGRSSKKGGRYLV